MKKIYKHIPIKAKVLQKYIESFSQAHLISLKDSNKVYDLKNIRILNPSFNTSYFNNEIEYLNSLGNILQDFDNGYLIDFVEYIDNFVEHSNLCDSITPYNFTTYKNAIIHPIDFVVGTKKDEFYGKLYNRILFGSFRIGDYNIYTSSSYLFIENIDNGKQYKYYTD